MKNIILVILLFNTKLALASDPTGMNFFVYGVFLIPALVIFGVVWMLTKRVVATPKIKFLRALPFIIFLAPSTFGSNAILWPAVFVLIAGATKEKISSLLLLLTYLIVAFLYFYFSSKNNDQRNFEKANQERMNKKIILEAKLEKIRKKE